MLTPSERATKITTEWFRQKLGKQLTMASLLGLNVLIANAIRNAERTEREACVLVALDTPSDGINTFADLRAAIADHIRQRDS